MARSCRLTCLKIEGNSLLKEGAEANLRLFSEHVIGDKGKLLMTEANLRLFSEYNRELRHT